MGAHEGGGDDMATPRDADDATRWLSEEEQDAWRTVAMFMIALPSRLDSQLQCDSQLTFYEYMVLSFLSMSTDDTARMSDLARVSTSSLSRLSNVAKKMESRGWLTRCPDPDDGRFTLARLTAEGRRIVEAAAPGHVEMVRQLVIDPLTAGQVRALVEIGRRLRPGLDLEPPAGQP
jgi:DNA-binding MarR family transcriptional regulator